MKKKLIISLIIGFALAMILMSIAIYLGYSQAYSSGERFVMVKLLGLRIYKIRKAGAIYAGQTIGTNMGMFCGICMLITVMFTAAFGVIKKAVHRN